MARNPFSGKKNVGPALGAIAVGGILMVSGIKNIKVSQTIRDVVKGDNPLQVTDTTTAPTTAATPATPAAPSSTGAVPKLPKILLPPRRVKVIPPVDRAPVVAPPPTASTNRLTARHSALMAAVNG